MIPVSILSSNAESVFDLLFRWDIITYLTFLRLIVDESNEYEVWWKDSDWWIPNYLRETSAIATFFTIYTKVQKFASYLFVTLSCISSKESTATSEHVQCWCLQFEHWRKLKQQEITLLNPARCLSSAPSQTRWHVTLTSLSLTHLIQRAPMPHVVQRSWKWQACKVTWIA